MSLRRSLAFAGIIFLTSGPLLKADPPTDPKALAIYNHDKEWLSHFPPPFVATNIRGQGMEYAERRQAALDLVREQRDFGVVSELMDALQKNSFLSGEICDILAEWKSKRALPLLKTVQSDDQRSKEVRDKAGKALAAIEGAVPDQPPVY
jgi:hypothetical protein